jgi:hypothetical protein
MDPRSDCAGISNGTSRCIADVAMAGVVRRSIGRAMFR